MWHELKHAVILDKLIEWKNTWYGTGCRLPMLTTSYSLPTKREKKIFYLLDKGFHVDGNRILLGAIKHEPTIAEFTKDCMPNSLLTDPGNNQWFTKKEVIEQAKLLYNKLKR